jgi:hypothetical protein
MLMTVCTVRNAYSDRVRNVRLEHYVALAEVMAFYSAVRAEVMTLLQCLLKLSDDIVTAPFEME